MKDKFLYFCDPHYGATPISRKNGYNEQILAKLRFVLTMARKHDCVVLCGGDFFDKSKIPNLDLIQVMLLFKEYFDVPFYCIRGNEGHDGFEQNSPLSVMRVSSFFKEITDYADFNNTRVIFKEHGKDDMSEHVDPLKCNIMMTHETLVTEPIIFEHTLFDDFNTLADVVCVAHYHPYQGILSNKNGTVFVAPGALCRRKRVPQDTDRTIKAVYIEVNEEKKLLIKELNIPYVKDVWTEKSTLDIQDDMCYDGVSSEVGNMKKLLMEELNFSTVDDMLKKYAEVTECKPETLQFILKELSNI